MVEISKRVDKFADRMKRYEDNARYYLMRKSPVIIRINGKAFHTFTKNMDKPFDDIFIAAMQKTTQYLCDKIQGCVFGYAQSDEITLVLIDYIKLTTDSWYGYVVQKMSSVSASMATMAFNKFFRELVDEVACGDPKYNTAIGTAMFDARVFSVPAEEVCNCLVWRQSDAIRNSIEAVGLANMGRSEMQGKSCERVKQTLASEHSIVWDNLPIACQRGTCCYRVESEEEIEIDGEMKMVVRNRWVIDDQTPIFSHNRDFIERWI